jgi:hypothetical protein
MASPHSPLDGSPMLSKGRASEDISSSSLLDLMDTKYQDFEVSLDSSFCLPFAKTSGLQCRPPTPPPARTKRKSVTFAAPPEEAVRQLETSKVPAEVEVSATTNRFAELEYLEPALELARDRGNESSSRVDDIHCLGRRLATEPRPLPHRVSQLNITAQPLPLLSSPLSLRQGYSHRSGAPLSTTANAKQKHRARDPPALPSIQAESNARGNYLMPIMMVGPWNIAP